MNVYVMRHGESTYNLLGLSNDDPTRDVRLTQHGIEQSERAAEELRHVPIQHIYVSELPRTRETAEIMNQYHNAQITQDERLNDRKTGFDGKPSALFERAMEEDPFTTKVEDGESFLEEKERVYEFLGHLHTQPHDTVLIVTHSEIMKIINGHYKDLSNEDMWNSSFDNCEILTFQNSSRSDS